VAKRLRTMSTAAESECFALSSFLTFVAFVVLTDIFLSFFLLSSSVCSEFTRVSSSSLQPDDCALMNAVNLLEET
jgi:hypothetical protein